MGLNIYKVFKEVFIVLASKNNSYIHILDNQVYENLLPDLALQLAVKFS